MILIIEYDRIGLQQNINSDLIVILVIIANTFQVKYTKIYSEDKLFYRNLIGNKLEAPAYMNNRFTNFKYTIQQVQNIETWQN